MKGSVFDRTTRGLCLAELTATEPLLATFGPGFLSPVFGTPAGLMLKACGASIFGSGELASVFALALFALDLLLNNPHIRGFDFGVVSSADSCASDAELGEMTLASCGCHPVPAGACDGLPSAIPIAMTPVSPCFPMESALEPRSASALPGAWGSGDGALWRLGTWNDLNRCLSAFKVR